MILHATRYGRLFDWLVQRLNRSMLSKAEGYTPKQIGMVDIFGFEIFEHNSFEQLCINYCNERLVQHSNQYTFVMEEQFYKEEGVEHKFLKPKDLSPSLLVVDSKTEPLGLLVALDDESALVTGSDSAWISKSEQRFKGSKFLKFDVKQKMDSSLSFQVMHYAGEVKYNATGFVVKNRDTQWQNQYELCMSS